MALTEGSAAWRKWKKKQISRLSVQVAKAKSDLHSKEKKLKLMESDLVAAAPYSNGSH
jgi:hypothetical protein